MSLLYEPHPFTRESKQAALTALLDTITPDRDYYLLLVGAALLAIGGIFLDSIPVLVASMIVAPLAMPILGLGLGIASRSWRLTYRSIMILAVSFILALGMAMITTKAFGHTRVDNLFISFTPNRYLATAIAIIAGCIAAYGLVRPKVNSAITGVAIAVSLMPPLVATGIEYASNRPTLATDALILFGLNVVGILVASAVVFKLLGVAREYRSVQ
jgi:uncharacterized hydrophobic protein (TIGR00271 family)